MPVRPIGPQLRRPPVKVRQVATVLPQQTTLPPTKELEAELTRLVHQVEQLKGLASILRTQVEELENQKVTLLLTGDLPVVLLSEVEDQDNTNGAIVTLRIDGHQTKRVVFFATAEIARKFLQKAKKNSWGKNS